eukprot:CAMPEP_0197617576 /NCGR_PEP_ID=MMETSP1326-20131121/61103_1 /TAXON_ID=1155430 /ORGANISM="Genus nov. species nov., Strain RCC2288" /LENGTH=99 /DNA_ID=CAMNT_0043186471 /DNA_START=416 /DNA_END=713 /DNA_ORIENTATION=+
MWWFQGNQSSDSQGKLKTGWITKRRRGKTTYSYKDICAMTAPITTPRSTRTAPTAQHATRCLPARYKDTCATACAMMGITTPRFSRTALGRPGRLITYA